MPQGRALNAAGWKEWWSGERGTQGHSLLQEFYEEQPSGYKTAWHRRQLWVIYDTWKDRTPLEAALQGKGEAALEDWAAQGRVGSSKWPRQRGEVVAKEQWEAMLRELRERQKATTEKAMELRQQQKKRKQERAEEEAAAKRRTQEERSAARLKASRDKKKQPVLHRVDRESHGGVFDKMWRKGKGVWVRTARPLGRTTEWLRQKAPVTSVQDAKNWPENRMKIRMAVSGGWLEWAEEESAGQSARGTDSGPPASSRDGEPSARPGGQGESNVEVAEEGRHQGERRGTGRVDGEIQDEQVRPSEPRVNAPAADGTGETDHRRLARARGDGTKVGKNGTPREPVRRQQPRGAASAPPQPPPPHQAQPHGERRRTRSRTGAPAKPREGIG